MNQATKKYTIAKTMYTISLTQLPSLVRLRQDTQGIANRANTIKRTKAIGKVASGRVLREHTVEFI